MGDDKEASKPPPPPPPPVESSRPCVATAIATNSRKPEGDPVTGGRSKNKP